MATRSVTGSVRSTRRWASLRQHVSSNEGGKPRVELLLDPPGSKSSTPSSQPHTPNTPRTPHTPLRKSNWEVIEHFTGGPPPRLLRSVGLRYPRVVLEGMKGKGMDAFRPGPASRLISKATLAGPALDRGTIARSGSYMGKVVLRAVKDVSFTPQLATVMRVLLGRTDQRGLNGKSSSSLRTGVAFNVLRTIGGHASQNPLDGFGLSSTPDP
ncbi:hypothetical protein WN48_08161 [Eufriesea mexicana]|uniref:Uncharacterized protein n=1 Tax=Eufriesea mexicana TaxID=516756 RepID=A0A310SL27_9HYME|nr:hypothetical protein WN48_08161 [Eufriesea mexicana]